MTWIYHERTDLDRERAYQEWVSSGMGEGEPPRASIAMQLLGGILAIAASAGFWAFCIWAGTRLWRH